MVGMGPLAQALDARAFDEVFLLSDYDERVVAPYLKWLRTRAKSRIEVIREPLSGPTEFGEIYEAAVRAVQRALSERPREAALTFHLSPGTPAMAAVWILLEDALPAELISPQGPLRTAPYRSTFQRTSFPIFFASRTSGYVGSAGNRLRRQSSPTSFIGVE